MVDTKDVLGEIKNRRGEGSGGISRQSSNQIMMLEKTINKLDDINKELDNSSPQDTDRTAEIFEKVDLPEHRPYQQYRLKK